MTGTAEVVRNADKDRYEVFYDGDLAGFAEYTEDGSVTVFTHTEVDSAFEGKGLGSKLAAFALRDTVDRGHRIRPECEFIRGYLDRHPEYAAQVTGSDGA